MLRSTPDVFSVGSSRLLSSPLASPSARLTPGMFLFLNLQWLTAFKSHLLSLLLDCGSSHVQIITVCCERIFAVIFIHLFVIFKLTLINYRKLQNEQERNE